MYNITKEFEFAYAHRIWNQKLNGPQSLNAKPKCRNIHGHNARVIVALSSPGLQSHGVVLDYNELNFFKKFLDEVLDHKYIIDESDPLLPQDVLMRNKSSYKVFDTSNFRESWGRDVDDFDQPHLEYLESFVIVPFVPTSENLAKWLFENIEQYLGKMVASVTFSESAKTTATYFKDISAGA